MGMTDRTKVIRVLLRLRLVGSHMLVPMQEGWRDPRVAAFWNERPPFCRKATTQTPETSLTMCSVCCVEGCHSLTRGGRWRDEGRASRGPQSRFWLTPPTLKESSSMKPVGRATTHEIGVNRRLRTDQFEWNDTRVQDTFPGAPSGASAGCCAPSPW